MLLHGALILTGPFVRGGVACLACLPQGRRRRAAALRRNLPATNEAHIAERRAGSKEGLFLTMHRDPI
jgi:hypothetical protein